MSKLLLTDLEDYITISHGPTPKKSLSYGQTPKKAVSYEPTPKKTLLSKMYDDSITNLHVRSQGSIVNETTLTMGNPEKLWKSHETLPSLRSRRKVPILQRNEPKRTRAGFIMNFVLKRLKTPLDGYTAPIPPSVGSYETENPMSYVLPRVKTVTIAPEHKKPVKEKTNEREFKPRRFVRRERGEMWPEDNKYGEEEHNLRRELKTVVPNRKLVPVKDSAGTFLNKHSYYRAIKTDAHNGDINLGNEELNKRLEMMRDRLQNLKTAIQETHFESYKN